MSSRDPSDEKLERLVGQVLRDQPLRQAPPSLEGRVLRELTARARLPWWRRGIASWPATVRIPVIVGCAVCVPLVWILSLWLAGHLLALATHPGVAEPIATLWDTGRTLAALGAIVTNMVRSIPRVWVLGGIMATAILYAALFGLIAGAYSLLCPRTAHPKAHT
jgi:hypothetical protein